MMKLISRWLLKGLTAAVPITIAACYGAPVSMREGKVVDATTSAGIPGIKLTCQAGGADTGTAYSGPDGSFALEHDHPCDQVVATDPDGVANGGTYQAQAVAFPASDAAELSIALVKAN